MERYVCRREGPAEGALVYVVLVGDIEQEVRVGESRSVRRDASALPCTLAAGRGRASSQAPGSGCRPG